MHPKNFGLELILNDRQVSQQFHKALTYQWSISILFDQQSCQLMVVDEEKNAVEMLADLQMTGPAENEASIKQALAEAVENHELLPSGTWDKIKIIQASTPFTLIPDELFNAGQLSNYAKLAGTDTYLNQLSSHQAAVGLHVVFGEEKMWLNAVEDVFLSKRPQVFHAIDGFLLQTLRHIQPGNQLSLFCHIGSFHVMIAAYQGRKLLLLNNYMIQDDNSLLYFIQLVAQEIGFSNMDDTLFLAGPIMPGSLGYEKLGRFFARIQLMGTPTWLQIPADFNNQTLGRYSLLMSNHLLPS